MNRRTFFRCLAVLAGAFASKSFPARAAGRKEIEIQRSPVAGFQYGEGESL